MAWCRQATSHCLGQCWYSSMSSYGVAMSQWFNAFRPKGQYALIGSDNGLAPNRRQAIIWTNDGIVYWRIYASPGHNELTEDGEIRLVKTLHRDWNERSSLWRPCHWKGRRLSVGQPSTFLVTMRQLLWRSVCSNHLFSKVCATGSRYSETCL